MRDEQVDLGSGEAGTPQRLVARVRHRQHGGLEHFAARHLDVVAAVLEQLLVGRMHGASARAVQQLGEGAVGLQAGREDAAPVGAGPHDRRSGPVAEQHGRRAVLPVGDRRELLRRHDQHVLRLLRGHEALRDAERVEKPRAGRLDVERRRPFRAQDRLEIAGLGGEQPVRGAGGDDQSVEVERCQTGLAQRLLGRRLPHAGVRLLGARHAPLANARALADPLVRGLEELRELVVRHHAGRRVAAAPPQLGDGSLHATAPPSANSAPMSCDRWLSTIWVATRTAFMTARAGEAPWQMIATPFTPKSGAPPYSA